VGGIMDITQIREAIISAKANQKRKYELGFIIIPDEAIVPNVIEKVKGIIKEYGGSVISESEMGRRKLAYPIKKNRVKYLEGIYRFIVFEGTHSTVQNLDRLLKIDDNIIRYIILRVVERKKKERKK
jgi:small subunit ribosomal protein S6